MLLCVSLIPESSVMTSFVSPVGVTPGVTASKEISASPTVTGHFPTVPAFVEFCNLG